MQIEGCSAKCSGYETGETPQAGRASGTAGMRSPASCEGHGPPGPVGVPLGSEEMIQTLLGIMSSDITEQTVMDRAAIRDYKKKCRAMRKKILEQMKKIHRAARQKRRRGILAKIFKWAAAVLGAIAAVAAAVFTGGQSLTAYAIAVGVAVAAGAFGAAGGGCRIAASCAAKKELGAAADLSSARTQEAVAIQMQDHLMGHMQDLVELDARIGEHARTIAQRYDEVRQQSIQWR